MIFKILFPAFLLLLTGCLDAPCSTQMVPDSRENDTQADHEPVPVKKMTRPESLVSMFRSDDLGRSWTPVGDGLPEDLMVSGLDKLGNQIVLSSINYGIFLSNPGNQSWQQLDTTSLPSNDVRRLHVADGVIYAGVHGQGIFASADLGKSWVSLVHNLKGERINSIVRAGSELLIATDRGIFSLKDGAATWRQLTDNPQSRSLLMIGDNLVAGTHAGIIRSSDYGKTWSVVDQKIKAIQLCAVDDKIVAIDMNAGLALSEDMGKSWQPIPTGAGRDNQVFDIVNMENSLLRSQSDGIYRSQDWGKTWKDIYHFSSSAPFGVMLTFGRQWNEVYSRPEVPMMEFIVVDGVVYGATLRGC